MCNTGLAMLWLSKSSRAKTYPLYVKADNIKTDDKDVNMHTVSVSPCLSCGQQLADSR